MTSTVDYPDALFQSVLTSVKSIALLGASDKAERPSHRVMKYLLDQGYRVYPVNPRLGGQLIHGCQVYASLDDVPESVDMIELFLNSDAVGQLQSALVSHSAKVLWMQKGVINTAVAEAAEAAGKTVIMDHCPKEEIPRLGLEKKVPG